VFISVIFRCSKVYFHMMQFYTSSISFTLSHVFYLYLPYSVSCLFTKRNTSALCAVRQKMVTETSISALKRAFSVLLNSNVEVLT
jgi:hypothetical protein